MDSEATFHQVSQRLALSLHNLLENYVGRSHRLGLRKSSEVVDGSKAKDAKGFQIGVEGRCRIRYGCRVWGTPVKGMPLGANSVGLPRGNFAAIHWHRYVIRKNYCALKVALQIG